MALHVSINCFFFWLCLLISCTVWDSSAAVSEEEECGRPAQIVSEREIGRIVGGKPINTDAFPWTVLIKQYGHNGVVCGGAILSDSLVLTAAHCFDYVDESNIYMWVGKDAVDEFNLHQRIVPVSDVIKHEGYNPETNRNDIALITTSAQIDFNSHVKTICLPNSTYHLPDGHMCLIAGYGTTQGTGTERRLNYVSVPLISNDVCAQNDWLGEDFSVIRNVSICAGYGDGGPDACTGDSGGALVCRESTSDPFVVYGISSWGKGCGEVRKPGVYASVPEFVDWINAQRQSLTEPFLTIG